MKKQYCVCTEQATGTTGYSMRILAKFNTKKEAINCLTNDSYEILGLADYYYIQEIWFRE